MMVKNCNIINVVFKNGVYIWCYFYREEYMIEFNCLFWILFLEEEIN